MPTFAYRGIEQGGKSRSGTLEAADRRQVIQKLRASNIQPVEIRLSNSRGKRAKSEVELEPVHLKQEKPRKSGGGFFVRFKSSSRLTLPFFSKLHQLHGSGMSIGDAVNLMTQRMADEGLRELSAKVYKDLSEGRTLAASMRSNPEVFDSMMSHLVEAGEATGNIAPILQNLIGHLERLASLKKKLFSALAYPIFLITVAMGVVGIFLFFLMPRLQTMLDAMDAELNISARILMSFSEFLLKDGPFVIGAILIAAILILQWRKSEKGRVATDRWLLQIPLIKGIVYNAEICRLTNVMSILLGNGVNTTETLRLAENTLSNRILLGRYQAARAMINDGAPFSAALKRYQLLPDLDLDIISIGENTGSLVDGFREVYKTHAEELESKVKFSTGLISGLTLASAFAIVAVLTLGILMSIMSVSQSLMSR